MVGAWDSFSWCHCLALLRLATKFSRMEVDVDALAYRLHRPMNCG
jgi:hypothetical protein